MLAAPVFERQSGRFWDSGLRLSAGRFCLEEFSSSRREGPEEPPASCRLEFGNTLGAEPRAFRLYAVPLWDRTAEIDARILSAGMLSSASPSPQDLRKNYSHGFSLFVGQETTDRQ